MPKSKGKRKIPRKVNILGHDYKVLWVKQEYFKDGNHGECVFPDRIIRISKDMQTNPDYAWIYFLHEYWHGVQFERGDGEILSKDALELHADGFASAITSLQQQGIL